MGTYGNCIGCLGIMRTIWIIQGLYEIRKSIYWLYIKVYRDNGESKGKDYGQLGVVRKPLFTIYINENEV